MKKANPNLMITVHTKRGKQMKSLNYWQQFVHTGSIEDYLFYARQERENCANMQDRNKRPDPGEGCGGRQVWEETQGLDAGAGQNAGIHMCNRNDIEADACRGV